MFSDPHKTRKCSVGRNVYIYIYIFNVKPDGVHDNHWALKRVKTPQIYGKFAVLISADRHTDPSTGRVTIYVKVDPVIARTNVTKSA